MSAVVYVNGTIADAAHATVPVFDHGFLYGEGIYETLRTYRQQPFLFERHMRRLRQSASLMALDVPFSDEELRAKCDETVAAHPELKGSGGPGGLRQGSGGPSGEAYIRILLTRGVGELTYNPAATPTPSLVIIVKPFPAPPERTFTEGIRLALVSVRRNHPQALNPMIKSNNLINNALAMQEALRQGADEALMQNQAGELVECSQSNFFVVRDGAAVTAAALSRTSARDHPGVRARAGRRARDCGPRVAPHAGRSHDGRRKRSSRARRAKSRRWSR